MDHPSHKNLPALLPALAPADQIRLITRPSIFKVERVERTLPYGATIREMVESSFDPVMLELGNPYVVVGDQVVPPDWYGRVRPKPGQLVTITIAPGDSGGGGNKDPLRVVLTIAVIAASVYIGTGGLAGLLGEGTLAAGSFGAGMAAAGVPVAGKMVVNATAPEAAT